MHAESLFNGRLALVTGGGRGIGAATAEVLAEKGARVFVVSRSVNEIEETIRRIGERVGLDDKGANRVRGLSFDLTQPRAATTLFDKAEKAFGLPVSILVNNAGIGYVIDLLAVTDEEICEEWDRTQAINVRAPFLLTRELMKRFQNRKPAHEGCVVNIGSLGGIRSTDKFPGLSIYVASKFAVAGLTEALAVEGRPLGIRVNAVAPGAVDTEMLRKAAPHLKTETKPEDVARVIVGLCDPSVSKSVTGAIIEIHSNL